LQTFYIPNFRLGWSLLVLGLLVLTGMDKYLEAWAVELVLTWVYTLLP
jgi:hypothetical protein